MNQRILERVAPEDAGLRLDVFLAQRQEALTRAAIKRHCDEGRVFANGMPAKASLKVEAGQEIELLVPAPTPADARPEDIPLEIVYEDGDFAVVNKPRGLVVHPAAGNETGTLVNALLHHMDGLSGINGELKPGIVHRIDKDTTGLLVVAKNDTAHRSLAAQIKEKSAGRVYIALVQGNTPEDAGRIEAPVGRDPRERKRMAVVADGRPAATCWRVLERFGDYTLVECRLETGRTHQIRVHMKHIGHPVVGDTLYGYKKQRFRVDGQLLHATRLELCHPTTGEAMAFDAPLPADFERILQILRAEKR